jgi:hypothetical protein
VQASLERALARRGYVRADPPDLLVRFYARVGQQVRPDDPAFEPDADGPGRSASPYVYDAATLVIDVTDARTGGLLWRGWSEDSMAGSIDNQTRMESQVDRIVRRIVGTLPAAGGAGRH